MSSTMLFHILPLLLHAFAAHAVPAQSSPSVVLDNGKFTGVYNSTTGINRFLGIPFAQPPLGELRFNLPVPNNPYEGEFDASTFGYACIAQGNASFSGLSNISEPIINLFETIGPANVNASEDCLTVNVFQPANISQNVREAKLPVLVWIFGGGFETGSPTVYPGDPIVSYSTQLGKPILFVSINYRLSAFGWIASQEVKDAGVGNIGLHDQRLALRWVQKYIAAFGGDPTKVTIWGESAGAISVAFQLIANNGDNEGLFHGAIMDSGSAVPTRDITRGQKWFDLLAQETGCAASNNTLACLRAAPLDAIVSTIQTIPTVTSYQSLNFVYGPGADGILITDDSPNLIEAGKVANVPLINGDVDDEGTLFTLPLLNITTDEEVHDYLSSNYLPKASSSQINQVMNLYPMNYTAGSPFDTGLLNALTPQYKRLAAIQGDLVFQGPRRYLLQHVSSRQQAWSYLSKQFKSDPILGSCHGSELIDAFFMQGDLMEYFINFVNDLNPNSEKLPVWPSYTTASPQLLTLQDDPNEPILITKDTYREQGISYLTGLLVEFPL